MKVVHVACGQRHVLITIIRHRSRGRINKYGIISRKRCKIATQLQWKTDRKSYVAQRMMPLQCRIKTLWALAHRRKQGPYACLNLITGPPNGPVLFCWLLSGDVVVCTAGVMEYVRPPQKSAAFRNTIAGRRTIERCKSRPLV